MPEQEIGRQTDGTSIRKPGTPPDWSEVRKRSESLLARSKDLRVAIRLTQALTEQEGLAGLALVHALVVTYWDGLHPRLEADAAPTFRNNALQRLADPQDVLRSARNAVVVPPVRAGRVTVRGVLLALGHAQAGPDETVPPLAQIEALLAQSEGANPGALVAAGCVSTRLDVLEEALVRRLTDGRGNDLGLLKSLVRPPADLCSRVLAKGDAVTRPANAAVDAAGAPARFIGGAGDPIRSREDAVRELARICAYIEQAEPSHPAPLLIRRAQRLLRMNFIELIWRASRRRRFRPLTTGNSWKSTPTTSMPV